MKRNPPKEFRKLASAPTMGGILAQIERFYCGSKKTLERRGTMDQYTVLGAGGTPPRGGMLVIETTRGFFFGYLSHEK